MKLGRTAEILTAGAIALGGTVYVLTEPGGRRASGPPPRA